MRKHSLFMLVVCMLATVARSGWAVCGDSVVQAPEECDDGGFCSGSTNAGTACTADSQCPQGTCRAFGGDGCAANCTTERDLAYELLPGVVEVGGMDLQPGTSGVVAHSSIISLALPLSGRFTWTIGKERDGQIPVVVKSASVVFPGIDLMGLACGCVHGAVAMTCGGTFLNPDGKPALDCTQDNSVCAQNALKPCTAIHGPGNSASGIVGCQGLDNINLSYSVDAGGDTGEASDPVLTLSGTGGPGAASVLTTIGVDVVLGRCMGTTAAYGPDQMFCTSDDGPSDFSIPATNPAVTGTASALVTNTADGDQLGPIEIMGSNFPCTKLAAGNPGGGSVVSAFAIPNVQMFGAIAVTVDLAAKEVAPPPCTGDCNRDGEVTVDEIITMVNIALGTANVSACMAGDSSGDGEITVDEIVAAVGKALNGCS